MSSSASSASPENEIMGPLVPDGAAVYDSWSMFEREGYLVNNAPSSSPAPSGCSFPITELWEIAFSSKAFPYAKYRSAVSGALSPSFSVL